MRTVLGLHFELRVEVRDTLLYLPLALLQVFYVLEEDVLQILYVASLGGLPDLEHLVFAE